MFLVLSPSLSSSIGTEEALHNLIYRIEKALEKNEYAIVVFLDINGAFNNVSTEAMLRNMAELGVEKEIIVWARHMLNNRKVSAFLNDEFVSRISDNGTPQGGILSVDLWDAVMHKLLTTFPRNNPTESFCFADDDSMVSTGIDEATIASNLQKDLDLKVKWAEEHQLEFSATKTKAMIFTRKKNCSRPKLFLQGEEIEYVSDFKYLGVTIDENLTWAKHIENVSAKATGIMMQIRKQVGKTWGLNAKICR